MRLDLNGDGGRHKAQLETEKRKRQWGSAECLKGRGRGGGEKPLTA